MAIVTDNGNLSTSKIKPGSTIFFNRDGTITGKAGYTLKAGATALYAIGEAHPYDANAYLAQFGYTWDAAGFQEMDGDYVGVWSSTNYMVDGIAATHQEPIETNPNFVSIAGDPTTPINGAFFDPTTNAFIGWMPGGYSGGDASILALVGVQAYLATGLVVRITNASLSSSDVTDALALLGIASDNVTAGIITFSYSYPAFLCTNVTYKEIPIGSGSATFTITTEYTFTPPNGWNPLIYP
jgi:hypothetical protein